MGEEKTASEFTGCKLAYILDGKLLVYKRDDRPDIPFPNQWDFPGGGREGDESPEACVLRELMEEFSMALPESRLIYKQQGPDYNEISESFFFVVEGRQSEIDNIAFGDEGQYWEMMAVDQYMSHPESIAFLKARLSVYLAR